jgi:hypothetical protein
MRLAKWSVVLVLTVLVLVTTTVAARTAPKIARLTLRVACPTVFIEERPVQYAIEKIRHLGFLPVDPFRFTTIRVEGRTMHVEVLGVFRHHASYHAGEGCVIEN